MRASSLWMLHGFHGGRRTGLCLVLAALLVCDGGASAQEVVRSGRALADAPTQLVPAPAAPLTTLRPQAQPGGLAEHTRDTSLRASSGPQTVLREAEVPRARLQLTRALLAELHARPTPEQAIAIDLPADVLFDFDQAVLRADAAPTMAKASELIKSYASAPIVVLGHTDGKGTDAYNDALSLRRAQAVAQALQQQTGRLARTEGRGKREPVAPNVTAQGSDDPQGRQRNRRVQILIGVASP